MSLTEAGGPKPPFAIEADSEGRPSPGGDVLPDPWAPSGILPLDRLLERNQYPPWLTALLGLVGVFLLFQVIIAPVAMVVFLFLDGVRPDGLMEAVVNVIEAHAGALIKANTIGQVLGIALTAWLLARWHSSDWRGFLRLRSVDGRLFVLAVLGLVALTPLVQWVGHFIDGLPWPAGIRAFEAPRAELIEKVFEQHLGFWPTLFMLAITPALCEEMFFRGYLQRQLERSLGVAGGILATGVIFGAFHISLIQLVPLTMLGLYMAYVTWRTGSLWPAVAVHFANNGLAVLVGSYAAARPDVGLDAVDNLSIPWYILVPALGLFAAIMLALHRLSAQVRPVPAALSPDREAP